MLHTQVFGWRSKMINHIKLVVATCYIPIDFILVGGFNPSEKYESRWDYELPNIWKNNPNVPNHQPDSSSVTFL
jgi:hypothetical protein